MRRTSESANGQAQKTSPTRSTATRTSGTTATTKGRANFTTFPLLIADIVNGKLEAVPRGVMAAGAIMDGARGGVDLPKDDIDRVKSHLAKYYKKMGDTAPWER
jgi:hypothetical protein